MKWDQNTLQRIFDKTNGRCHLCRKVLRFHNYGKQNIREAWEVEHSIPRARGGTDHINNLYPACITCNRKKGSSSTRSARAENGYRSAPFSKRQKQRNVLNYAGIGTLIGFLAPPPLRLTTMLLGMAIGAVLGNENEPD